MVTSNKFFVLKARLQIQSKLIEGIPRSNIKEYDNNKNRKDYTDEVFQKKRNCGIKIKVIL